MIIDVVIGFLVCILVILILGFVLGEISRRKSIVLDDPTDDPDYQEIVRKLRCPQCGSDDYSYEEVTTLPWVKNEDRYCICNHCGCQFGDGK